MHPFQLDIFQTTDDTHLRVVGELDLATAPQLLDAILVAHRSAGTDVTIDLRDVPFVDSRGLAALVTAHRRLSDDQAQLRLVNACPAVVAVLEVTGVGSLLHVAAL